MGVAGCPRRVRDDTAGRPEVDTDTGRSGDRVDPEHIGTGVGVALGDDPASRRPVVPIRRGARPRGTGARRWRADLIDTHHIPCVQPGIQGLLALGRDSPTRGHARKVTLGQHGRRMGEQWLAKTRGSGTPSSSLPDRGTLRCPGVFVTSNDPHSGPLGTGRQGPISQVTFCCSGIGPNWWR
jgi:hypothetical protein